MRNDDRENKVPRAPSSVGLSPTRMAQAFFSRQIRLERGAHGLTFVLEDPASGRTEAEPAPLTLEAAQDLQMRADLTALLNAASGSRHAMRHLAALEHGLVHKDAGALFLFDVPAAQLRVILRQFDGLLVGAATPGLSALRGHVVDAIGAQEARRRDAEQRQPISSFLVDHKLEVGEARASDFDRASTAWQQAVEPPTGR